MMIFINSRDQGSAAQPDLQTWVEVQFIKVTGLPSQKQPWMVTGDTLICKATATYYLYLLDQLWYLALNYNYVLFYFALNGGFRFQSKVPSTLKWSKIYSN